MTALLPLIDYPFPIIADTLYCVANVVWLLMKMLFLTALLAMGLVSGTAKATELIPFVIPATPNPASALAFSSLPIPPDGERLVIREGHFSVGTQRVRIWGVNTCFGANFPTHANAERIASRLAAGGVNSVRFHHMDSAAFPRGILDPQDARRLSAEALDRLDYFIAQLARHGIYANINLHVGRAASQFLGLPQPGTHYDKIVGLFTPVLIEAQKQYASDLLGHTNAYRKVRYADDAAVAFVEITNEDSFFMWSGQEDLQSLPEFYAAILRQQYATWLKTRYGSTARLRTAWADGAEPLGRSLLAMDVFPQPGDPGTRGWRLEQHGGSAARIGTNAEQGLRIEIAKVDDTRWHVQVKQAPLSLRSGQYYTLSFRARADRPRTVTYGVAQDHAPWAGLGLSGSARLSTSWQVFRAGFSAAADDEQARLSFGAGGEAPSLDLADVSLAPGGGNGLLPDESLEKTNIALFGTGEVAARALDRQKFLTETEKAYFDGMRTFLKQDLSVKALVTGTIVFGPSGLSAQMGMDYLDTHAYWQHPHFPGKAWDQANWTVEQRAMVDHPTEATLPQLAAERLNGKPFTVSEYNHPAPNDFQAECVTLVASYAAAQDWDGIWLFAYSHRTDDVDREAFQSFFDIDANPSKWGFMLAGASIFRQSGMGSLLSWTTNAPGRGTFSAAGAGARVLVSHAATGSVVSANGLTLKAPAFAALTVTALDGQPFARSRTVLVAACGRCENQGMAFSPDRRTVGRAWGTPPVAIEPVNGEIALPGSWTCHALHPDGTRGEQITLDHDANGIMLTLSPDYRTMWYLLESARP